MALAIKSSGTQTATISSEHTLLATTDSGVYLLHADLSVLQTGDNVELRIKEKVLSGGTIRVVYFASFTDAQSADDAIAVSVPIAAVYGITATLKQTAGTGRAFPWRIDSL